MKKKQAWKVMGAVLAGALILSDAAPLRASAASETEKSAVQNQPSSRTENDTETESQQIAIYINLKKGSDTADGTSAEKAVKTVEKAQELLKEAVTELQEDPSAAEKNRNTDTGKTDAAAEKYLVFVGMDEKELETLKNMGIFTTMKVGFSYLASQLHKRPDDNLENFYINRFGKKLYSMFFEYYTENLWGRHPREIDASWGAQRVKGLSIVAILQDIFGKIFNQKNRKVETSLIEQFKYPKLGPGELWEVTASEVEKMGGTIIKGAKVTKLHKDENNMLTGLTYEKDGAEKEMSGDVIISSMPVKDLVGGMNDVPETPARIAKGLPYRDYMTLGVLVPKIKLKNKTKMKTVGNIVPDCWVYVQDRRVKMGRFQIYNNWSPYMVKDLEHTVWIGLEYFVNEGDEFWNMTEDAFSKFGVDEMVKLGLIDSADEVLDSHMERVKKAYPAYFDTYDEMDTLIEYLNTIPNLYCVGRNGQHRYNNIDHSMVTSFEAVKNILSGEADKSNVWNVNTEKEYHEESKA